MSYLLYTAERFCSHACKANS